MSGEANHERKGADVDDMSDDEAERLAAEAERWLDDKERDDKRDDKREDTSEEKRDDKREEKGEATAESAEEKATEEAPLDEVEVRELLRRALRPPAGAVAPSLLSGVQKKLRTRSKGKFYGDGWSTARSPRSTYLVTSALMLVLLAFVFLILLPWGGGALP